MTTSLHQSSRKRGSRGGPPLSPRGRAVALAVAAAAVLLLVASLAAALSGGGPFAGDEATDEAADRLPSGWVGLEPLLPLAPSLKEMSDLKRSAARGASRVLAARDGSDGALRVRALPSVAAVAAPSALVPAATPRLAGLGSAPRPVDRIVGARRLLRRAPGLGDLGTIIDRELGGLPGGTVDGVVRIPPIDPLPNGIPRVVIPPIDPIPGVVIPPVGVPLPGVPPAGEPLPGVPVPGVSLPGSGPVDPLPGVGVVPGSGAAGPLRGGAPLARRRGPAPPLNLTLADLRSDPRLDVLLVSRGRRVLERYTFRDDDVPGLSAQINIGSRLLAAEPVGDAGPLAHVVAAPLAGPAAAGKAVPGAGALPELRKAALRTGRGVRGARRSGKGASAGGGGSGTAKTGGGASASRRGGGRAAGRKARGGASAGRANGSSPRRAGRGSRSIAPSRGRSRPNRGSHAGGSSPRGRGRHRGRGHGRGSPGHGHSKPKKHRGSSRGSHGHGGDDDSDDDDEDD